MSIWGNKMQRLKKIVLLTSIVSTAFSISNINIAIAETTASPNSTQTSASASTAASGQPEAAASSVTQTVVQNDPLQTDGDKALDLGDYARAQDIFTQALKQKIKDATRHGSLEIGLAEAFLNQGKFAEAA